MPSKETTKWVLEADAQRLGRVADRNAFKTAAKVWIVLCAFALLLTALRCTPAQSEAFRCKLGALEELPDDPGQVNLSDVVQLVKHVQECKTKPDAGAQ